MVPSFSLRIRQQVYTAKQIKELSPDPSIYPADIYDILEFCKNWLCGQETFRLYTSGSTGQPKPIFLNRSQMEASARQTIHALGLQPGSSALLCLNPTYIGGKMMLVRAMEGNFTLSIVEAKADPLANIPENQHFDFIALVPLQLKAVIEHPHSNCILQKAKAVIIGGAPVSLALRQKLGNINAPLFSTYGMTETVSHIALQRLNGPEASDYFIAFPDIQLSLDERGCLEIIGKVTRGGKVVTNDIVQLLSSHRFTWTGRVDHIINSGGIKIQLDKIDRVAEACLLETGNSRQLFSWGFPDERLGQKLVLIVEGRPLNLEQEKEWFKLLKEQLVKYEQPKAVFYLEKFTQTPSGKIQKAATASLVP